jgi:Caspase domain
MLIEVEGVTAPAVTHAFVVGVSHYPFLDGPLMTTTGEQLGMANLSSAARSASEVVAWLLNEHRFPDAPLKDVRVLLSPVDDEVLHPDVVARLGGQPAPATRETVRKEFTAFKNACAENTANRAFVFLTGHGIQLSSRGAILLLEDFATPEDGDLLFGAMDVMGCHASMWAAGQADHQVWFSDACRQRPEIVKRYESVTGAWKPGDNTGGDVAATPILLSSGAREQAFADPQGLTLFTDALLWGLRGGGVVGSDTVSPQWHVSTERLSKVLQERVRTTARAGGANQSIDPTGKSVDVAVHLLDAPPQVDIEVTLNPPNLDPLPTAVLKFGGTEPVTVDPGWPLKLRGAAGLYSLTAEVGGPAPRSGFKLLSAAPPVCKDEVQVP